MADKENMLALMRRHLGQRSGMDWRNYASGWNDRDGMRAFRAEQNQVARDGRDARALLAFIESRDGITAEDLQAAARGGRLDWTPERIDYTTGQYFAVEYRAAACRVMASAIWHYLGDGVEADRADKIRKAARGYFGRGIASRWFV